MSNKGWQQIKALFVQARELSTTHRDTLLGSTADPWLRQEVASLLAADRQADGFLERPRAEPPPAGARVGLYRLCHPLGSGGMGLVYLAVRDDGSFQKRVAIKVLRGASEPALLQRFRIERQILAALDHPNVVRLHDGGHTEDGSPYLVMEYVQGLPIDEYCQRHDLPTAERLRLFQAVCSAVHCAHQNLVVHGDIKPGNILVTPEGVPKLLDFGAARFLNPELGAGATEPSEQRLRLFTPEFASPEQLQGEGLSVASDVYSLGLLLYALLTGQRPYLLNGRSPVPQRLGTDGLPQPSEGAGAPRRLRGELDSIVRMATRKDARQRYDSVQHFADDVGHHLAQRPVQARPATLGYRAGKLLRRNAGLTAMAIVALFSLCIAAAATAWMTGHLRPAPPQTAAASPGAAGDAWRSIAQIRGAVGSVELLAQQGDLEAQMALPLLYFAHGHLLMSAGDSPGAMRSFRQAAEARRTAPKPPWASAPGSITGKSPPMEFAPPGLARGAPAGSDRATGGVTTSATLH